MKKRISAVILTVIMLFTFIPVSALAADTASDKYTEKLNGILAQLAVTVSEPSFGTSYGEWSVISLARGGYYASGDKYFSDYYGRIVKTVKTTAASVNMNGALHKVKSTENSRLIMALAAIGMDPKNVGGIDLVEAYSLNGFSWITKQGINGPIFALIAIDSNDYETSDDTIRQQCVDYILNKELANGGWALSGTAADPDMTSMALQALAKYKDNADVAAVAERAFTALSNMQKNDGGFASWGSVNCESIAQVIVACTAWDIDPNTDSRFVKSGGTMLDAMFSFYVESSKGFKHVNSTAAINAMATDQATYALVAYTRFKRNENSLYNMSDVPSALLSGDASGDNVIDITDMISIKKIMLNDGYVKAADFDNNKVINALDFAALRRLLFTL